MDSLATVQFSFFSSMCCFLNGQWLGDREERTIHCENPRFQCLEIRFCTGFIESLYVIQLRKQLIDLDLSTDRNITFFDLSSVL